MLLFATCLVICTSAVLSQQNDRRDMCTDMMLGNVGANPEALPRPFDIRVNKESFTVGETVKVSIVLSGGDRFRKFMIMARLLDSNARSNDNAIGYFQTIAGTRIVCQGQNGNAITNTDDAVSQEHITIDWNPPSISLGHVQFRATVVMEDNQRYWVDEFSNTILDERAPPLPQSFTPAPGSLPEAISTEQCGSKKGCYRNPPGCSADDCDILVTWKSDSHFVDFEMTADSNGWVAVGFSDDLKMGNDEVWDCAWSDSQQQVVIMHSKNVGKTNNVTRVSQSGLHNKFGLLANGRISCYFRQNNSVPGRAGFFAQRSHLLLAKGRVNESGFKLRHTLEPNKYPYVSTQKVSMSENVDLTHTARYILVKVHGCLMLIAWMMCASTALLLAKYYKPMWPNNSLCGEKVWFAVHRGCMITCLICTIIAFIIIFVHTYGYSQMPDYPDKAHPPLGICTTILCVLNAILALFRCSPESSYRPIFNWLHWFFGTVAYVLSTPTIFIGLNLPKSHVPWWATWVMVAFMLFHLVIELMLEIHGCLNARKQKHRDMEYEKRMIKGDEEPEPVGTRFKKNILTVYLVVVICLGIVMVISVAAG